MSKLIEIKNLVTNFYTYEGVVKALNNISLEIDKGITFGLVGESGCGKSVTVRSLMKIVQSPGVVESGQMLFHKETDGKDEVIDLMTESEKSMRSIRGNLISMIFQEPNAALNPILSIGYQISESFLFHQKESMCQSVLDHMNDKEDKTFLLFKPFLKVCYGIGAKNGDSVILKALEKIPLFKWDRKLKKEATNRSIQILKELQISNPESIVKAHPHNLSGGMKQRVVIAIALACHPTLLIADEATSNLDVTIQAQILELLAGLKKTVISSILLITHDLGVVAETCDRVGVMYAGNVCEVADVKAIFEDAQHPYTKALLNSVPTSEQKDKLESIEGNVPNLVHPPTGCRFHPRCPLVTEICKKEVPELRDRGDNHLIACHAIEL